MDEASSSSLSDHIHPCIGEHINTSRKANEEFPLSRESMTTPASLTPTSTSDSSLHHYRVLEYMWYIFLLALSVLLFELHLFKGHQRAIPSVRIPLSDASFLYALDPSLSYPLQPQQVSNVLNWTLSYGIPLGLVLIFKVLSKKKQVRVVRYDVCDFVLSGLLSASVCSLVTKSLKLLAGRLRPNFHALCGWDETRVWNGQDNLCTLDQESEARKSFPSGHASTAFSGLFLATLYLMGRCQCVRRHEGSPLVLLLTLASLLPTTLATWIAMTRTMDNYHHFSDIVAGALIGGLSARYAYRVHFSSVFSPTAGQTLRSLTKQRRYFRRNTN